MPKLSDIETISWLLEGVAETVGININLSYPSPALLAEIDKFDKECQEVLEAFFKQLDWPINVFSDDYIGDDIVNDDDISYNVFMTLNHEGVGVWDGRMDHFFINPAVAYEVIEEMMEYFDLRLQKFADGTGGGTLNEALLDECYRSEVE